MNLQGFHLSPGMVCIPKAIFTNSAKKSLVIKVRNILLQSSHDCYVFNNTGMCSAIITPFLWVYRGIPDQDIMSNPVIQTLSCNALSGAEGEYFSAQQYICCLHFLLLSHSDLKGLAIPFSFHVYSHPTQTLKKQAYYE